MKFSTAVALATSAFAQDSMINQGIASSAINPIIPGFGLGMGGIHPGFGLGCGAGLALAACNPFINRFGFNGLYGNGIYGNTLEWNNFGLNGLDFDGLGVNPVGFGGIAATGLQNNVVA